MARLSIARDCPWIKEALEKRLDVHTFVATKLFSVAFDAVTLQQRSLAKQRNFSFLYGTTGRLKEFPHG